MFCSQVTNVSTNPNIMSVKKPKEKMLPNLTTLMILNQMQKTITYLTTKLLVVQTQQMKQLQKKNKNSLLTKILKNLSIKLNSLPKKLLQNLQDQDQLSPTI
jgi:hypothetical protein